MEDKWATLHAIYKIIRDNPNPVTSLLPTNELILRQNLPWDELVNHLKELQDEGYITMRQLSVAVISITDKGLQIVTGLTPAI
jgi:predicted transcriptional regulator